MKKYQELAEGKLLNYQNMERTYRQRIQRVINHNHNRGLNSERVNNVYRKIIAIEFGSVVNKF